MRIDEAYVPRDWLRRKYGDEVVGKITAWAIRRNGSELTKPGNSVYLFDWDGWDCPERDSPEVAICHTVPTLAEARTVGGRA
jgi:hypothetical protein